MIILLASCAATHAATTRCPYTHIVSARDPAYGVVCNNVVDDTAHIQAAIDAAYATSYQAVLLPEGRCKTTGPIFLDPPNNLRCHSAAYSAGTTYAINATVSYGGYEYISL